VTRADALLALDDFIANGLPSFGDYQDAMKAGDPAELSPARAREMMIDARRSVMEGNSPAHEKQRAKRRIKEAKSFGEFGQEPCIFKCEGRVVSREK
jgi:hypothetical protein